MLRVSGIGNLTCDCDVRYIGARNTPVCTFPVAFNHNFRIGEEWKKEVAFVECELWGRRIAKYSSYLKKGQPVSIAGHMVTQSWDNPEKGRQNKLVLKVGVIEIVTKIKNGDSNGNGNNDTVQPQPPATHDENGLPF